MGGGGGDSKATTAVVCPANRRLQGSASPYRWPFCQGYINVETTLHVFAGEGLQEECDAIPPQLDAAVGIKLDVAGVALTSGHDLLADYVIHAVAPRFHFGGRCVGPSVEYEQYVCCGVALDR